MDIDLKTPEVRFALELMQYGSELSRHVRAETAIRSILKQDRSPVTLADMGIQAIAGALLEKYLPGAIMVAEEDTQHLRSPEGSEDLEKVTRHVKFFFSKAVPADIWRWIEHGQGNPEGSFWTLDPIDGTKGFLRGGQYVTALARIRQGKVDLAAIGCPELELQNHEDLGKGIGVLALRGQGCWAASLEDLHDPREWVRLKISDCRDVRKARILDSFDPEHKNVEKNRRICDALGTSAEPVLMDSMAKQAVIASGNAEIFLRTLPRKEPHHREKIWDVAAGALAIEEAGGRVTDLEGRELDFGAGRTLANNPGLVATNGWLHELVLEALHQAVRS